MATAADGRRAGGGLRPSAYHCLATFARELDGIWRRDWVFVGHRGQAPGAGDFFCVDVAGTPVVVVNDGTRLAAFNRTCRHRWVDLLEPGACGHLERFRCPYHLWSYDLRGELVHAPHMEGADGFDQRRLRLIQYRVTEWHGLVFVALSDDAPDLATELAPLEALAQRYRLGELRHLLRQQWKVACNWKFLGDNSIEGYHHMGCHRSTLQRAVPGQTMSLPFASPRVITLAFDIAAKLPPAHIELEKIDDTMKPGLFAHLQDDRDKLHMWFVYPNLLIVAFRGQVTLFGIGPVRPDESDWSAHHLRLTSDPDHASSREFKMALAFFAAVNDEDMEICAAQQRYLSSLPADCEMPVGPLERAIRGFHAYVRERTSDVPPADRAAPMRAGASE